MDGGDVNRIVGRLEFVSGAGTQKSNNCSTRLITGDRNSYQTPSDTSDRNYF